MQQLMVPLCACIGDPAHALMLPDTIYTDTPGAQVGIMLHVKQVFLPLQVIPWLVRLLLYTTLLFAIAMEVQD